MNIETEKVQRAQTGELVALNQLYQDYSPFVWKVLCRLISNSQDRQDVLQDCFIHAFDQLKQYRYQSKFSTWLYRVTLSVALNHLKKERRRSGLFQWFKQEKKSESQMEETIWEEESIGMQLLEKLNPCQRACVVLKDIEELSYEEISEILHIRKGTVCSNLYRGRAMLRKYFLEKQKGGDHETY